MDAPNNDAAAVDARLVNAHLRDWFPERILARAREYARSGAVLDVAYDASQHRLAARVQGSDPEPYHLRIELPDRADGLPDTDCECPYGVDCKHAAAALLVWAQSALSGAPRAAPEAADTWLRRVEQLLDSLPAKPHNPAKARPVQQLRYILRPAEGSNEGAAQIEAVKRRLLKDGDIGSQERWSNFHQAYRNPPSFADDTDLQAFAAVARFAQDDGGSFSPALTLRGKGADHGLRALLATGRLHWLAADGPVLKAGAPCTPQLEWQLREGRHHAALHLGDGATGGWPSTVLAESLWLVAGTANGTELRPVRSEIPAPLLDLLLRAPPLPAAQAARLKLLTGDIPQLPAPPVETAPVESHEPQPVLELFASTIPAQRGRQPVERLGARLRLCYGATEIAPDSSERLVPLAPADTPPRFALRNPRSEQAALARLEKLGFAPAPPSWHWQPPAPRHERYWADREIALSFLMRGANALLGDGWDLRYDDSWPLRPVEPDTYEGRAESSGIDWFELHLIAHVGHERIDVAELLAQTLDHYGAARLRTLLQETAAGADGAAETRVLCPSAGRLIALPLSRVRAMLELMLELFDGGELEAARGQLRVSRFDLARLAQLEHDSGCNWHGSVAALSLARRLAGFQGIPAVAQPAELQARLRDYQLQGLAWMQFLREYELCGVLADEMGLGKTVQTLAHLLCERAAGRLTLPALVVAPTSVLPNWEREAARFAPTLRTLTVHGTGRQASFGQIDKHDLILTSYPLLARDAETWLRQRFHLVVLDEAQTIKNPRTQAAQTACALQARHRLALSGTPMENHLGEIWALFHFLMPGLLGEEKRFERSYRRPIEKQNDALRRRQLIMRLAPFVLRRSKERVAGELPAKTETVQMVRLEGRQRELYETVRAAMDEKVRQAVSSQGLARSRITILDALLKLRQVCCDPRLLPAARADGSSAAAIKAAGSAKLDALMELLDECRDSGRHVLVFSQFTGMLDLIEPRLQAAGLRFVRLDGGSRDRHTPVAQFQARAADVFLISLKAGGTGLNLTAADTVIHYDPWWNPAVEAQATGRAHRIGQDKPVFVYRLVCEGSVEEKIIALQARKAELAAALLDGSAHDSGAISAEDLQQLLAPLPA
ncbi:MAG: DEAD/DEAH box helicase [Solimonas sp.]